MDACIIMYSIMLMNLCLHYAHVIVLLYVYVCSQTCMAFKCMCVLLSIFMQVDVHEYVGMYICMCVSRNA